MTTKLRVQGNHIHYIFEKFLGFKKIGKYDGTKQKHYRDEYNIYEVTKPAIATNGTDVIHINFYQDYFLTVKNNLFTFAIVSRFSENNIIRILTDEQQEQILKYLGVIH